MTKIEIALFYISSIPVGRKMDVLVAERIMGICAHKLYAYKKDNQDSSDDYINWRCKKCKKIFRGLAFSDKDFVCPNYSTNIADAWEIVEFYRKKDMKLVLFENMSDNEYKSYYAYIGKKHRHGEEPWEIRGENAPEAICRAGLAALWEF